MATIKQLDDHAWMLEQLQKAQEADHDQREIARESAAFINSRGGMWEQKWWDTADGKPRYSFDLVTPIIDQVQRTISRNDFSIEILPAGGEANDDDAEIYSGLVRNIENISNAREVYAKATKSMAVKGLDGWRVIQKYIDSDSFDQDLVIAKVPNWLDSVWLGPHTEEDGSDAPFGFVLVGVTKEEFKERYPDEAEASVGTDRTTQIYYYRKDLIMIGEFLHLKPVTRDLVMMTNGQVYEDDKDFKTVKDELLAMGFQEQSRRTRKKMEVWSRKFSADNWLGDAKKTVFENWIPLIPLYANFDTTEDDKIIYYGAVEKLIDPQRVFNYAKSREVEEGALAPRAFYWMTKKQAAGHEKKLATMNVSADPVRFFNPDPELPGPPMQTGGAQINPGLNQLSADMRDIITLTAGKYAASMGDNPGLQSGKAIEALQDKGDAGSDKYIQAREVAMRQTGRILVNAIPRVYLPGRQVRLLREDGTAERKVLGEEIIDRQTGQKVVLHDLSRGAYDVVCTSGPSFQNRQSQTVTALTEVGAIDPSVIQMGGDILLRNINSPGMDDLAERKRAQLIQQQIIPFEQLTDEEKQQVQAAAQQPPQPDPNMVLAQAEQGKAEALMVEAQTKQMGMQVQMQDSQTKQQVAAVDAQSKEKELQIRAFEAETDRYKADIDRAKAMAEIKGKAAQAAKLLAEAEAIDIANTATESGVMSIIDKMKNGMESVQSAAPSERMPAE